MIQEQPVAEQRDPGQLLDVPVVLRALCVALRVSREKIDPELPSQHLHLLVYVALNPGLPLVELGSRLNLSRSATSRIVHYFSERLGEETPGPGLVMSQNAGPGRGREKHVRLTTKGQEFMQTLFDRINTQVGTDWRVR